MSSGNSFSDIQLEFERIDDVSVLSNFFCGVNVMDEFIHADVNGLQSYIDKYDKTKTYLAKIKEEIVAFFSILESEIILDADSKDDMKSRISHKPERAFNYPEYLDEEKYPAIEIVYLAVEKSKRNQGIGRAIIMAIAKIAENILDDCDFLTVDAYHTKEYSAVGFYSNLGFDKKTVIPYADIWPMYYVINHHIYGDDEDD